MKKHSVLIAIFVLLALIAVQTLARQAATNPTEKGPKGLETTTPSGASTPKQGNKDAKKQSETPPKKGADANSSSAATKNGASPNATKTQPPAGQTPGVYGPNEAGAVQREDPGGNSRTNQTSEDPDNPIIKQDDLGMLSWLRNPILFGLAAFLLVLAIALHLYQLLKTTQISRDLAQVMARQQRLAQANQVAGQSGKNTAIDSLSEQVNKQIQGLGQLSTRLNQIENRLTLGDSQATDTIQALGVASSWIGQSKLLALTAKDGGQISEDERKAAIAMLERYKEPLRINADRVEPLAQALAAFIEQIEDRSHLSPELVGRVQKLYQDIGYFDQWQTQASGQLASLHRGSFSQRSTMLQSEQQHLVEQAREGTISMAQMVQKSRDLLEQFFPNGASQTSLEMRSPLETDTELKRIITSAPDYLMDWFNSLYQLQNQLVSAGARSAIESEIFNELIQIQKIAQEVIGKFDIQLESIQVGQTNYDRRLHEATMVRQSSQFPTNTVIEVHRCGFRRMSNGEVLRRPEVVVAGAAAG